MANSYHFLPCYQYWESMVEQPIQYCLLRFQKRLSGLPGTTVASDSASPIAPESISSVQLVKGNPSIVSSSLLPHQIELLQQFQVRLQLCLDASAKVMGTMAAYGRSINDKNYAVLREPQPGTGQSCTTDFKQSSHSLALANAPFKAPSESKQRQGNDDMLSKEKTPHYQTYPTIPNF